MAFENPPVVGEHSFEGVPRQVDEEQPQAGGKHYGAQHRPSLHRHGVSAQKEDEVERPK